MVAEEEHGVKEGLCWVLFFFFIEGWRRGSVQWRRSCGLELWFLPQDSGLYVSQGVQAGI